MPDERSSVYWILNQSVRMNPDEHRALLQLRHYVQQGQLKNHRPRSYRRRMGQEESYAGLLFQLLPVIWKSLIRT